jgi:hypothetical protein
MSRYTLQMDWRGPSVSEDEKGETFSRRIQAWPLAAPESLVPGNIDPEQGRALGAATQSSAAESVQPEPAMAATTRPQKGILCGLSKLCIVNPFGGTLPAPRGRAA